MSTKIFKDRSSTIARRPTPLREGKFDPDQVVVAWFNISTSATSPASGYVPEEDSKPEGPNVGIGSYIEGRFASISITLGMEITDPPDWGPDLFVGHILATSSEVTLVCCLGSDMPVA